MRWLLLSIAAIAPAAAQAEVVSAGSNGFHVRHQVPLAAGDADAWSAFADIGAWWSGEHSYSGDARNMSLALAPGGCFCERLPGGGGIEHMRVAYVEPGKRAVLTGSLGPLLFEATSGVMDVTIEPSGSGSSLTLDYKVAGFAAGGADSIAPAVDQMLAEQLKRFRAVAASSARKR